MKSLLFFAFLLLFYAQYVQAQTQSFSQNASSKKNRSAIFGNYNDAASATMKMLTVSGRGNKSYHSIDMLFQEIPKL